MKELLYFYQEKMFNKDLTFINKASRSLFLFCAIVGVLFLFLFLISHSSSFFAAGGFFFMIFSAYINAFWVFCLAIYFFFAKEKKEKTDVVITIGIMLLNIPLAAICAYTGTFLMDYFHVNI